MTSGSLTGTASLASNALLLQGTGSVGFATTASLLAVSSSQQQISSSLLQVSASYIALSASYTTFSGSASTRITANSSSIQQVSSSQQQISASLLNVIANYATTGSNSFRANQSITGSLVVSSTITAQTLVVQTVTSSIVYSSGSNIFGSQLSDRQTFTGSIYQTGSIAAFAGSVGIGTTNPSARLDVQGGSDGEQMISIGSNNVSGVLSSAANIYINADSNNDDANGQIQLGFNRTGFTGGIPVITIKETNAYATGSVGIGTTSTTWSSGGTTYAPVLNVDGGYNNVAYFKTNASGSTAVTINSPVYFLSGDSSGLRIFDVTNSSNNLKLSTLNSLILASTTTSNIMQLAANGNVGINVTPNASKFQVSGSISSEKAYNSIDDGLILHFPFSENTGTTAIDRSQTGLVATLTNGPTWANGIFGYGVTLDGTNDYISVSSPSNAISLGTTTTLSMWINISSFSGKTRQYLIDTRGDGSAGGTSMYFLFDYVASGVVSFTVGNSGVEVTSTNVGMPTGTWHHVSATRNGSTWKIYLNGVEVKSGTSNTTALSLGNSFRIGTYAGAGAGAEYYLQGTIDEVKIYNRTLSPTEISLLYYGGISVAPNQTYTEIATGTITYNDAISAWWFKNSFPANIRNYVDDSVAGTYSDTYNDNYGRGISFDLGSPKAARRIVERGYSVTNIDTLTVQYSNDASNWVTILTYPYVYGNVQKVMDFNQYGAIYARYWRWYISGWTAARAATNYYTYENIIYT